MTKEETKRRFQAWCQREIGNNCSKEDYAMFNNIMALLEQEPCEDTVSREKVWYIMTAGKYTDESCEQFIDRMVEELNDLPLVTPIREKGKWIEGSTEQGALGIRYTEKTCSKCGWSHSLIIPQNYCPKCGTEMRGSK